MQEVQELSRDLQLNTCSVGVTCMCGLLVIDAQVIEDVRRIVADKDYVPREANELCSRIFTTCFMGSTNSSQETTNRAKALAAQLGRFETF